ncbi:MAG TPA: hypothetical protein VFE59_19690 [Trebonia sp.]|nr:hypothetical protein [Trebonia sp.]
MTIVPGVYLLVMLLNVVLPTGLSGPRAYFDLDWITLVVMFIVASPPRSGSINLGQPEDHQEIFRRPIARPEGLFCHRPGSQANLKVQQVRTANRTRGVRKP